MTHPIPGNWYATSFAKVVYFVGYDDIYEGVFKTSSTAICRTYCETYADWKHLPDCTGFDYVEEQWPKYYVHKDPVVPWYIVRTRNSYDVVYRPKHGTNVLGNEWSSNEPYVNNGVWIEVTKEQALERVKPERVVNKVPIPLYIDLTAFNSNASQVPIVTKGHVPTGSITSKYRQLKWDNEIGFYVETTN